MVNSYIDGKKKSILRNDGKDWDSCNIDSGTVKKVYQGENPLLEIHLVKILQLENRLSKNQMKSVKLKKM